MRNVHRLPKRSEDETVLMGFYVGLTVRQHQATKLLRVPTGADADTQIASALPLYSIISSDDQSYHIM